MGILLAEAREMNRAILNTGGFESDITLTAKTDLAETATVKGTIRLHSTVLDPETGIETVGRAASVLFSIADLADAGYPLYRDAKKPTDIVLKNDIVEFLDASGNSRKFEAAEVRPSHTFGCVTLILKDRK